MKVPVVGLWSPYTCDAMHTYELLNTHSTKSLDESLTFNNKSIGREFVATFNWTESFLLLYHIVPSFV